MRCAVCHTDAPDSATSCANCGEASWIATAAAPVAPEAASEPEVKPEPVAEPEAAPVAVEEPAPVAPEAKPETMSPPSERSGRRR